MKGKRLTRNWTEPQGPVGWSQKIQSCYQNPIRRRYSTWKWFEERIPENVLSIAKDKGLHIQTEPYAEYTQRNPHSHTPTHTSYNLAAEARLGEKKNFSKRPEKWCIFYGETIWMAANFSSETTEARGSGTTVLKCLKTELSTQNSICSKNILQEWRWNRDMVRCRKTKRMGCQQTCFKRIAEGSASDRRETLPEETRNIRNEERATKTANLWVTLITGSSSPLKFFKCIWESKAKIKPRPFRVSDVLLLYRRPEHKEIYKVTGFLHSTWGGTILIQVCLRKDWQLVSRVFSLIHAL